MKPKLWVRIYVMRAGTAESKRAADGGNKTNIIIDESRKKQTIKGILASFTLIDRRQRWVIWAFRVWWRDSLDRKTTE